jgi:nucleoporin NUP82
VNRRTYDFNIGNELSFEVPDQTLDLYALNSRKRHTFSAEIDEMEPASCCFGSGDQGWRPFTLYILMRSGDVYALSPLVPSRWQVPRVYTQALSLDITAQMEAFTQETTSDERLVVRHQTKWINDVLNQQQSLLDAQTSFATPKGHVPTSLTRPEVVGPSPELQGPFVFEPAPPASESDDCFAACDIFHMEAGPVGVIGIIHSNGKLDIYIEPEPVTARWYKKGLTKGEPPVLAHFDTQDLRISAGAYSESTSWPTFTKDPHSTQLWFVNHLNGVTAFSLKPWLSHLTAGLEEEEDLLHLLSTSPKTQLQNIVTTSRSPVDGTLVVYEAYIGYILIASHAAGLSSVEFDEPLAAAQFLPDDTDTSFTLQAPTRRFTGDLATPRASRFLPVPSATPPPSSTPPPQPLSILQPPFVPSAEFSKPSQLPQLLRGIKDARKPVMFSAQSLTAFKQARDTLKAEFDALMAGAQEMYDRAAAQRLEYHKQLETLNAVYQRVGAVKDRGVRERLERFVERQEQMQKKAEGMLKELITHNVVGLSDAEKKWGREVERMMERVVGESKTAFGYRTLKAGEMVQELMPIAAQEEGEVVQDDVPKEVREGKVRQLRELLDREYVPPGVKVGEMAANACIGTYWCSRRERGWRHWKSMLRGLLDGGRPALLLGPEGRNFMILKGNEGFVHTSY